MPSKIQIRMCGRIIVVLDGGYVMRWVDRFWRVAVVAVCGGVGCQWVWRVLSRSVSRSSPQRWLGRNQRVSSTVASEPGGPAMTRQGGGSERVIAGGLRVEAAVVIFFFSSRRRHTRFDCDWSSDVCSSDLYRASQPVDDASGCGHRVRRDWRTYRGSEIRARRSTNEIPDEEKPGEVERSITTRSEERRVGKECRSRWSPYH